MASRLILVCPESHDKHFEEPGVTVAALRCFPENLDKAASAWSRKLLTFLNGPSGAFSARLRMEIAETARNDHEPHGGIEPSCGSLCPLLR